MCVALVGCQSWRITRLGNPAQPVTALERISIFNAAIANNNLAIAKGVMGAADAGAISAAAANKILTAQSYIADATRNAAVLMQKGQTAFATGDREEVRKYMQTILGVARKLVDEYVVDVAAPGKRELIRANAQAIFALAQQIIDLLNSAWPQGD